MPKSVESLLSFNAGELSPLLDARVDQQKYRFGCRQLQNLIASKMGAATRRPGTQYVSTSKQITIGFSEFAVRLFKFVFSPTVTFVIEMGNYYLRFYENGAPVTISTAPAWVSGEIYYVGNFVTDGGNIYICKVNTVSAIPPSANLNYWTLQNTYEITSPYDAGYLAPDTPFSTDIYGVKMCQINDVVYFVHPLYPVYRLSRYGTTNWTFEPVNFMTPAMLDENVTDITLAPSATTGAGINLIATAPAWVTATKYLINDAVLSGGLIYVCTQPHTAAAVFDTDFNAGYWSEYTVFTVDNIGGYFQIQEVVPASYVEYNLTAAGTSSTLDVKGDWTFQSYGTWSDDIALQESADGGTTWTTIRLISGRLDTNFILQGTSLNVNQFRMVITNHSAGTGTPRVTLNRNEYLNSGLIKITGYATSTFVVGDVINDFTSTTALMTWNEGAWSDRRGYPKAVASFQSRLIYASSGYEPQRIWFSKLNDIENFDLGDQSLATDSIAIDLNAPTGGPIFWLNAQVDLFAGLAGQEWVINSGTSGTGGSPITPTNIAAQQQSSWGSAVDLPGTVVGDAVFYSQRNGTTIRQLLFSISTQKYMSQDLMTLSQHLSSSGIVGMDFQAQFENQGIVWMINGIGELCGMTYEIEQEVFGWHRHTTGDDLVQNFTEGDAFESIACIPGQGNNDDETWVVVARKLYGSNNVVRYIERINPYNWQIPNSAPDQNMCYYVDSGVQFYNPATNVFTGFNRLANRPVAVCVNSQSITGVFCANDGSVTVPNYVPALGDVVSIGLAINYALQPMRLDSDPRNGNLQGMTKQLADVYVRLHNSLGGNVQGVQPNAGDGLTYGTSVPINYLTATNPLGSPPAIFTGEKRITPFSDYSNDSSLIINGSDPLPLTVLALIIKFDIAGTT